MPRGFFDPLAVSEGWFDPAAASASWFDRDLVDNAPAAPPPVYEARTSRRSGLATGRGRLGSRKR